MTAHARDLATAPEDTTFDTSSAPEVHPLVLVVLRDHWTGALVHAELIERGHDAACASAVAAAVVTSTRTNLARASVIVVEEATLSAHDRAALVWLRALDPTRSVILLTSASAGVADGPWDTVLRRPITIAAIADAVEGGVARAGRAPARHTPEPSLARRPPEGFEVRVALPWPMIRCQRCLARRHCETPRTPSEKGTVLAALVTFGLEHAACGRNAPRRVRVPPRASPFRAAQSR